MSLTTILLSGCGTNEKNKEIEKPIKLEFELGESFDLLIERYPMMKLIKQPVGANFYKMRWSEENPASILFKLKGYNIEISHAIQ